MKQIQLSDLDMVSNILLIVLPIPSAIVLILLTLYHLTPLIHLLPIKTIRLSPLIHSLSTIIPRPRSNLPRDFFNLPPRSERHPSSYTWRFGCALGLRGKLILLLAGQASLSLACGWGYLLGREGGGREAMLAISVTALPSTILLMAIYTINTSSKSYDDHSTFRKGLFGDGGITHFTISQRILPLSLIPIAILAIVSACQPKHAGNILLACVSCMMLSTVILSGLSRYHFKFPANGAGAIRLRSSSPTEKTVEREDQSVVDEMRDGESWITSPCKYHVRMVF